MIYTLSIWMLSLPLIGGVTAGLAGHILGRCWTHRLTITLMGVSLVIASYIGYQVISQHLVFSGYLYHWLDSGSLHAHFGIYVDNLAALMCMTVLFVSFLVHVYSIGYMEEEAGYQRFFCYMSLFTFMMLLLVLSDNLLQLFFGWEGVGVMSYLLIGFWHHKSAAASGSLKAFLVNRVGDFGLLLGVALLVMFKLCKAFTSLVFL